MHRDTDKESKTDKPKEGVELSTVVVGGSTSLVCGLSTGVKGRKGVRCVR